MHSIATDAWSRFLADTGRGKETPCCDCFYFCDTESAANALLELVLSGKKTATTGCKACGDAAGEPLPREGDLSIVTDFGGTPRCVIQTTAVSILPFCEMTYEICRREGEDDTLSAWQDAHFHFFTRECAKLGFAFNKRMDIVFVDFVVVYRF